MLQTRSLLRPAAYRAQRSETPARTTPTATTHSGLNVHARHDTTALTLWAINGINAASVQWPAQDTAAADTAQARQWLTAATSTTCVVRHAPAIEECAHDQGDGAPHQ